MEKGKNVNHPTSIISQLPLELETNILLKLPIKDLIRCQCVCKHWRNDIIKNFNFIRSHSRYLHESNKTNTSNSVILFCHKSSRLYNLDYHSPQHVNELTRLPNLPISMVNKRIVGSCYGLLCFQQMDEGLNFEPQKYRFFSLYNPVIGNVGNTLPPLFPNNEGSESMVGFGYDSMTHDYKILCIVYNYRIPYQAESYVYSLKNNSWKFIKTNTENCFTERLDYTCSRMIYSNNALYWIAYGDSRPSIIKFDLGREEYQEVPHPDHDFRGRWSVVDLRGCLHLVKNKSLNIWVRKEYGAKQNWDKLICTQLLDQYVVDEFESQDYDWRGPFRRQFQVDSYFPPLPLAYSDDGKQIVLGLGENVVKALIQCDLHSRNFKRLKICDLPDDWKDGYVALPWIGSLVDPSIF